LTSNLQVNGPFDLTSKFIVSPLSHFFSLLFSKESNHPIIWVSLGLYTRVPALGGDFLNNGISFLTCPIRPCNVSRTVTSPTRTFEILFCIFLSSIAHGYQDVEAVPELRTFWRSTSSTTRKLFDLLLTMSSKSFKLVPSSSTFAS